MTEIIHGDCMAIMCDMTDAGKEKRLGYNGVGIEIDKRYVAIAQRRVASQAEEISLW